MITATQHLFNVNGIRLHVAERGEGPPVLLLHGFPETSHSWRHQLAALSDAGFRAIAPDLRGFGLSDCPLEMERYTTIDVIGDLIGLLDAMGEQKAVVVGNDWGATIAWQAAVLRPDRFRAVIALGVPLMYRAPMMPSLLFPKTAQAWFYTHYFSQPGLAEAELERDVATTLRKIYYAASGDIGVRNERSPNPFGMVKRQGAYLDDLPEPVTPPAWLDPVDMDAFVKSYQHSGFRGGLNYYRNLDRNWELQAAFEGRPLEVPSLYLVGERDTGLAMPGMLDIIDAMPKLALAHHGSHVVPRAGHWLQQEAPDAVNGKLIDFLRRLL
ncbi:alpha/beta fold hydrolase [Cupriavidus pauculus]|uniref:Epoxide hydrolase n=1 Tax=Cupriavidus pauculus TaxID=82633 RepID=A0A2N5CDC1_9BURK|nr:alpha/beta hydrolase [Cupriavidus pauculus]PLQ00253.1 epoxide hydrolase [Cupriavidus pauculus]